MLEDKHPRQKFALTVGRGQFDIKVDAANRLCARWTSNVQGSDGQSPRANPTRGERARAPAGEKARKNIRSGWRPECPDTPKGRPSLDPYVAPWPRIRVRLVNRIRRRARMSASPTCERSSPRQRSNPLPGNRCLPHWRGGKPHRQNRKCAPNLFLRLSTTPRAAP